jgi:hypothetical protein
MQHNIQLLLKDTIQAKQQHNALLKNSSSNISSKVGSSSRGSKTKRVHRVDSDDRNDEDDKRSGSVNTNTIIIKDNNAANESGSSSKSSGSSIKIMMNADNSSIKGNINMLDN